MFMTRAKSEGQRSFGSKVREETDRQTDGRTFMGSGVFIMLCCPTNYLQIISRVTKEHRSAFVKATGKDQVPICIPYTSAMRPFGA